MVGNVTVDNQMSIPPDFYDSIKQEQLQSLVKVKTGAYVLGLSTTKEFRNLINYHFTEIRIVCTKPWHGRRVDGVLTGQLVDDLLNRSSYGAIPSGDYHYLTGDTSWLFNTASTEIRHKVELATPYYFPIYLHDKSHVSIQNADRIECDDILTDAGFQKIGTWQYYIR